MALQSFAWKTISNLTDPNVAAGFPDWEINWSAKCDIGLELPACTESGPTAPFTLLLSYTERKLLDTTAIPGGDLGEHLWHSLRLPVQLSRIESGAGTRKPSFAQVLFNKTAADAVGSDIPILIKNGPMPDFPPGSMIAKADWVFLPVYPTSAGSPVLQSDNTALLSVSRISGLPANPDEGWVKGTTYLQPPNGDSPIWLSRNITTVSDTSTCSSPFASGFISIDCLHAYRISPPIAASALNKPNNRKEEGPLAAARAALIAACGIYQCVAVLRGIHIMVRLDPADPLSDAGPWVFITYWWTGMQNQSDSKLLGPWNYFQMNVTQAPRDDGGKPGQMNICFNPYLEGTKNPAGASVNCLTCHQYAAYNQKAPQTSKQPDGSCLGNQLVGTTAAQAIKNCDPSTKNYFAGTTTTDRTWSMASLNDLQ